MPSRTTRAGVKARNSLPARVLSAQCRLMRSRSARALVVLGSLVLMACEEGGAAADPRKPGPTLPEYVGSDSVDERFDPQHVFMPDKTPPTISGGTLAVSSEGVVVAADSDRDQVYVIVDSKDNLRTVPLLEGDEPGRVVVNSTTAFVALRGGAALAIIDLKSLAVARIPTCSSPRGLALAGADELLVACAGGELLTLGVDGTERARVFVEEDIRDVGSDTEGTWVSSYRRPALLRVDAKGAVASRGVPASATFLGAFGPSTFSPTLAARTIATADGGPVMLHQRAQASTVAVSPGGYGGGQSCDAGIVHATLTRFRGDTTERALPVLRGSVVPVDVALSPNGEHLAVVSPGGLSRQRVPQHDPDAPASGAEEGVAPPSDSAPEFGPQVPTRQLALLSTSMLDKSATPVEPCMEGATQDEHLFPGEAVAVAFVSDERFVVQVREPAELRIFDLLADGHTKLSKVIDLSSVSVLHTGHQLFHQAAGVGIACASCHGEGHDDGHTWTFDGIGARRTQSLLGGVLASAPFHWDGDMVDLTTLMNEVFLGRMRGGPISSKWTGALAHFLDALPERVHEAPARSEAAQRGELAFAKAECTTCHAGPTYRVSGSFDVGSGGAFQVPSLIGVATRFPLMHSGCANSFEDRFDPACGGKKHGSTSTLTADERSDLAAFLSAL